MDMSTLRAKMRAHLPDTIANLRARATDHLGARPHREAGYTIANVDEQTVVAR